VTTRTAAARHAWPSPSASGLQILDVREEAEWDEGHIPGSIGVPYHDIHSIPDGVDPKRPLAVICSSGSRSAVAASIVKRHGADEVIHVADGGIGDWSELGYPIEKVEELTTQEVAS
jgi:hydroxyacylglutathione hydrolase